MFLCFLELVFGLYPQISLRRFAPIDFMFCVVFVLRLNHIGAILLLLINYYYYHHYYYYFVFVLFLYCASTVSYQMFLYGVVFA